MARAFGAARPRRYAAASGTPGAFPRAAADYVSTALTIPKAWGQRSWYAYRNPTTSAATRGELIAFGDSTLAGSGGDVNYPILQRIRAKAVAAGLTDGGKGAFNQGESATVYDSPEITGYVSRTGFAGVPDNWNGNGNGHFWDDGTTANATLNLQFRGAGGRLWYSSRPSVGQFQYRIDGGAWTTIDAYQAGSVGDKFVYLTGLAANTTHTLDIQNLRSTPQSAGGVSCICTFAPMNDLGLTVQNFATSGETFGSFNGTWRYWNPLGLTEPSGAKSAASSYAIDTTPAAGTRVKPVLAWLQLGFNDETSAGATAATLAATGVAYFAAACNAAGIDGIVTSGQLAYNANWPTYGAGIFAALRDTAVTAGLAWADTLTPIAGSSLTYSGGATNPHLLRSQYVTQADWLWDNLLGA